MTGVAAFFRAPSRIEQQRSRHPHTQKEASGAALSLVNHFCISTTAEQKAEQSLEVELVEVCQGRGMQGSFDASCAVLRLYMSFNVSSSQSQETDHRGGSAGHRKATARLMQGNRCRLLGASSNPLIPRKRRRPTASVRNPLRTT